MSSIPRTILSIGWSLLLVVCFLRSEAALTHIDVVHLSAPADICQRAVVPLQSGVCTMKAAFSWQFPTASLRIRPLEVQGARPVTVTSGDQLGLSYAYRTADLHVVGGMAGAGALMLICASLALLPFVHIFWWRRHV